MERIIELNPQWDIIVNPALLKAVVSSNVQCIGYWHLKKKVDREQSALIVIVATFKKHPNIYYLYAGFNITQYMSLESADSIGKYLSLVIQKTATETFKVQIDEL